MRLEAARRTWISGIKERQEEPNHLQHVLLNQLNAVGQRCVSKRGQMPRGRVERQRLQVLLSELELDALGTDAEAVAARAG